MTQKEKGQIYKETKAAYDKITKERKQIYKETKAAYDKITKENPSISFFDILRKMHMVIDNKKGTITGTDGSELRFTIFVGNNE